MKLLVTLALLAVGCCLVHAQYTKTCWAGVQTDAMTRMVGRLRAMSGGPNCKSSGGEANVYSRKRCLKTFINECVMLTGCPAEDLFKTKKAYTYYSKLVKSSVKSSCEKTKEGIQAMAAVIATGMFIELCSLNPAVLRPAHLKIMESLISTLKSIPDVSKYLKELGLYTILRGLKVVSRVLGGLLNGLKLVLGLDNTVKYVAGTVGGAVSGVSGAVNAAGGAVSGAAEGIGGAANGLGRVLGDVADALGGAGGNKQGDKEKGNKQDGLLSNGLTGGY